MPNRCVRCEWTPVASRHGLSRVAPAASATQSAPFVKARQLDRWSLRHALSMEQAPRQMVWPHLAQSARTSRGESPLRIR
jgi:hypothetical protein